MRELKFRAWHREVKEFHYQELLTFGSFNYIPTMPDTRAFDMMLIPPIYSELQQYTGLKDKNGKEIYEGDIVLPNSYVVPQEVMFLNGAFQWRSVPDNDDWELLKNFIIGVDTNLTCQIIGNIYENPELLERLGE